MITDEEIIILREVFPAWIIIRAVCNEFGGDVLVQMFLPFPKHPLPDRYGPYHVVLDPRSCSIDFDSTVQILRDCQETVKKAWLPYQRAPFGEHYQVALFHG